MIVIPRRVCRAIPTLARKCVSGRPRGPAPPVAFEIKAGLLTATVWTAGVALVYAGPSAGGDGALVVPMDAVAAAAGAGGDPVELVPLGSGGGEARWHDRRGPRAAPFGAASDPSDRPPVPPAEWHPVARAFLAALHECGRTAAREAGRFALDRVQVRGSAGEVAGTDGRTALVWGGFVLPFAADLLVPAVPVFGCPELARESDVRVGRTPDGLAVAAGPWRVHLPADAGARFPALAAVARRDGPTAVALDPRDAARLADWLPGLAGADAEGGPVTLDLSDAVAVHARDGATGRVTTVRLARSSAAGPPVRVGVDRRALARALALNCRTVTTGPGRPVVLAGGDTVLVAVALDPLPATAPAGPAPRTPTPERRTAVRPETNGHGPAGRPDPPAADAPGPLAVAEELRAALADAGAKAGRLVAALKALQKEKKALSQAWSSLRALNLGPGGAP